MYEDGTNVPLSTKYLPATRVVSDLYIPVDSKAPSDWEERWTRLRTRFEGLRDECRPIECLLVQKHTPEYARARVDHRTILRCFEGTPKHIGGLSREDTALLMPNGQPLFGGFAIRDADGRPMCNSAGDPYAFCWGLRRDFYLYPAPLSVNESRSLPGPQLMELVRDASGLLLKLPATVALSLWRNWRSGFSLTSISHQNLWLDAVFELAWQEPQPGHSLHADRFAWHDNVSVALHGDGLFPRLSDKPVFPDLDLIAAESRFPMAYYSKMPDVTRASVAAIDEILERGRINMSKSQRRFSVALSFPGERRALVEQVASILANRCRRERVLYDKYHEAEFAQPNLDTHLQQLYHQESDLIVTFLCAEYNDKEWCGLEWRAIRDLIKKGQASRIMLLRFDNSDIPGLFSTDGYIQIDKHSPEQVADLIFQRMQVGSATSPSIDSVELNSPVPTQVNADVSANSYLADAQRLNCLPRLVVDTPGGSGSANHFEFHFPMKNVGSGAAVQISVEIIHNEKVLKTDRLRDMPNGSDQMWKPGFGCRYPFVNMDSLLLRLQYLNILGKAFVSDFRLEIALTGDFTRGISSEYFGPPQNSKYHTLRAN